jgi:AraC family transcriptional regulator of adaptative response / DNA-3-methyladenine glycosylase II
MRSMPTDIPADDDDARYLALKARDARFDGRFFTGVTSTGIYCRPVCAVRTPRRENCRFFTLAAQAESAGFRPCLRCRPELAPQALAWSVQDASGILVRQALRLLDAPEAWSTDGGGALVAQLAHRLGVSDRHLRRIFEAALGVSPLQYLQTRRLLAAKQLLTDTRLPVTQVALASGFASVRRFNAAFSTHYGLNPTQLRREGGAHPGAARPVHLGLRPPYDAAALLGFLATRQIHGMESVDPQGLRRTVRLAVGGVQYTGWIDARFDPKDQPGPRVALTASDSLLPALPQVIARVRALLGQQITVAAARTLAQRLLERFGEPIATPWPGLRLLFPTPATLAAAEGDALGQLGIVRQRQAAIVALARAVLDGRIALHAGSDVEATTAALRQLPGIGDWTAQYIAMRALRWPDAFPAGDVALHKALGVRGAPQPARAALEAAQAWRPWRSYGVIRAWAALSNP